MTKHIQHITTSVHLDLKTNKLMQFLKQLGSAIRRWSSLLLGIIFTGSWTVLTVQNGNLFIREVLISSFIIICLLILKGPHSAGNGNRSN